MIPIEQFISQQSIHDGFAWKGLDVCCCDDRENSAHNLLYQEVSHHIDMILECKRRIVERNYYYEKVYVYDYYFTLKDDRDHIYVVQTNIRMKKYFSGKWHWKNNKWNSRCYKINKDKIPNIQDLFVKTYAVDKYDELYMICNSDDDDYKEYSLSDEEENESGRYMDYVDCLDQPPYSNLKFYDDIPKDAEEISIPNALSDNITIIQRIAHIMSYIPGTLFDNGR